jgi:hypothetical protein
MCILFLACGNQKPTIIITLEPCALNAEFQPFILRFLIKISYFVAALFFQLCESVGVATITGNGLEEY